jgi:hypothetical protein
MVDTTTEMTIRAESFVKPVQKGHEILNITDVAFLVEHEASGKKVMYITPIHSLNRQSSSSIPSGSI